MTDDDGDLARLGDLLDRSIGPGPEGLPTPADRLARGRRALSRRRRLAVAATSVGVVAAVGLGLALSGAGGGHGADGPAPPLATQRPSPSPSPVPSSSSHPVGASDKKSRQAAQDAQKYMTDGIPATYDAAGRLTVKDGWRITQEVDNPLGLQPPETSVGLVLEAGAKTRWVMLSWERAVDEQGHPVPNAFGAGGTGDEAGKAYSRFEDWLAAQVELQGGAQTQPLLTVDGADGLVPGPGAVLVETRQAPVIDGYTTQGDRLAEVRRDGRTWFVVVRGHGAGADVIPVDADVLPEPTFAAFVDHVRNKAASGEGLR